FSVIRCDSAKYIYGGALMIYLVLKNSVGIEASIAKFERSFLQPGGLHIIYRHKDKETDTIKVAIYTETDYHNDLVQVLAKNHFKDLIVELQLAPDSESQQ
ncbi:MAG: hypothetical protein AB1489_30720, partial [Acidobacteriota bacterium]